MDDVTMLSPSMHHKRRSAIVIQAAARAMMVRHMLKRRGKVSKYLSPHQRTSTNRKCFDIRHGAEEAQRFRDDVHYYTMTVKKQEGNTRLVVHPKRFKTLRLWDMVTTVALLYTATIVPFEVSFIPPTFGSGAWQEGWFLVNRLLDVVFGCDMVLQFFLAYETTSGASGGRKWVTNHSSIIHAYLRSWFIVDALTLFFPLGFDLYLASDSGGSEVSHLALLRTLRVVRLAKVVRLVRATRIYKRWRSALTLTYSTETLLQCFVLILITSHWYACIIALQATLHSNVDDTWLGADKYNLCGSQSGSVGSSVTTSTSVVLEGCDASFGVGAFYMASLSWSMMVITGTGGTDFYPSSTSNAETIMVTLLVLGGAFLWTIILAKFCDVATNSDPALTKFRQKLEDLNRFIELEHVPKEMAVRMREYLLQQKDMMLRDEAAQAIPMLSMALQIEVILQCNRPWLDAIHFLRSLEEVCLVKVCTSLSSKTLAPGELAPLGRL